MATLRTTTRRLRWQEGLHLALPALSLGLLVTLLLLLFSRFYPVALPGVILAAGLGGTLAGLLAVLVYAWLRPRPALSVARILDRRLNLDERVSTALELTTDRQRTPVGIVQAQLADTRQHLTAFDPARTFPARLSRRWLGLVCALSLAIAVGLSTPNPQAPVLQQRARTQEILEEQAAQLEEIRTELLVDEALLGTPPGQELLQTLDELITTLKAGELSQAEALAALSAAEQNLATLQAATEQQAATLNDLAQTFSQFDSTASLAEALEGRDLARAAEALTAAGNNVTVEPELAQNLAEALQRAAQAAQQAGDTDLADALTQASEALNQATAPGGDAQVAQQALAQVAEALAEAGEQVADQAAIAEALASIQSAREQLAQGNAPGGEGPGQGAGQGQGLGAVPGDGQNAGGSGREDPGSGANGLFAEQGAPEGMATDNGPNESRVVPYESLYAPQHVGGEGGPIVNPDSPAAEAGVPLGDAPLDPNQDPGAALVPYNQVYGQYADVAGEALDSGYIPLGMKRYIRQYFGALEPGGSETP